MKKLEFFNLFLVTVQSAKVNLPKYRTPRDGHWTNQMTVKLSIDNIIKYVTYIYRTPLYSWNIAKVGIKHQSNNQYIYCNSIIMRLSSNRGKIICTDCITLLTFFFVVILCNVKFHLIFWLQVPRWQSIISSCLPQITPSWYSVLLIMSMIVLTQYHLCSRSWVNNIYFC